ncbi:MerR family transcriptional regulator [Roseibium litorale]
MDKSPDAFRTISEVAEDLDLPQHVLRFWETRFTQIKPLKRGGGRRYYRPDDVELLRGIRHLLYGEGYTIKGVQRILKEQGPRFVMQIWHEDAIPLPVAAKLASPGETVAAPRATAPSIAAPVTPEPAGHDDAMPERPRDVLMDDAPKKGQEKTGHGLRFMERFRGEREDIHGAGAALSKDDIRRLQATLFELLECKRILDQAR